MPSLSYVFTDSDSDELQSSSYSSDSSDSDLQQPLSPSKSSSDSEDSLDSDSVVDQPLSPIKCSSGSSDFEDFDSEDSSDSDSEVDQPLSPSKCSSGTSDVDQPLSRSKSSSDSSSFDSDYEDTSDSDVEKPLSRPESTSGLQFSMKPSSSSTKASAPPHNWSEEEQIILLRGLIDFYCEPKIFNVGFDSCIFDDYIQKKLNHLQLCQINDGIAKLTLKFLVNMDKEKPPPPQDDLIFQLSKKLWGTQYYTYQSMKNPLTYPGELDLHSKYPNLAASFHNYYLTLIKRNINLIPEKKLRNIEKKLDKLQSQEDRVRRKRENVIRDSYRWLRQLDRKQK